MIGEIYKNRYYINGINMYERWGIVIEDGGYAELQKLAQRKEQYSRVWLNENGTQRYTANALFDSVQRSLQVTFLAKDLDTYLDNSRSFLEYISKGQGNGYFELYSTTLKMGVTLLYNSVSGVVDKTKMFQEPNETVVATHTIIFDDDFIEIYSGELKDMPSYQAYGVQWNANNRDSALNRVGNMDNHKTLPAHNLLRGCVLKNDGTINYYLNPSDWTKKEDGTASKLDGSDGDVMIEIPDLYFSFVGGARERSFYVHHKPFGGAKRFKKRYVSAYEATLERNTSTMRSVMNASDNYKGHTGAKGNLAPLSAVSRATARSYARKRKGFEVMDITTYNILVWLYFIEYANRNSQLAVTPKSNGLTQGGLGDGLTTLVGADWTAYNGQYGLPVIGKSNSLGNGSGEVNVGISEFPSAMMNRYRGVENFFGNVAKILDGIQLLRNVDTDIFSVFVSENPHLWNDSNHNEYAYIGEFPLSGGYVTDTNFPYNVPSKQGGGSSTTYYCDNCYSPTEYNGYTWYGVGGHCGSGALAGVGFTDAYFRVSYSSSLFGFRLCYIGE